MGWYYEGRVGAVLTQDSEASITWSTLPPRVTEELHASCRRLCRCAQVRIFLVLRRGVLMTVTIERRTSPPGPLVNDRRTWQAPGKLIGHELFRSVLVRERRRADRSDRSLILVLVGLAGGLDRAPARIWRAVSKALDACKRDTDVMGWFEQDQAVGIILPEIPGTATSFLRELETRVRRELAGALEADELRQLSVRLLMHPADAGEDMGRRRHLLITDLGTVEHSRFCRSVSALISWRPGAPGAVRAVSRWRRW